VLARNLRRLREDHGLSLSGLARRSGVAKATLSSIEGGEGNPTVATLGALAESLHISLVELLAAPSSYGTRVVRATPAESRGTDDELIESFAPRGLVEVYDVRYEEGDRIDFDAHEPGFVERVLVHEGRLRVGPVDEPVELDPGDFAAFPADQPHAYEALEGPVRAVLIAVHASASRGREPIHPASRS
jgi:transcriptional regulator with XRE-family HTH domain